MAGVILNAFSLMRSLIVEPEECWPAIKKENRNTLGIFGDFVVPAAAIWPLALFIGGVIFLKMPFLLWLYWMLLLYFVLLGGVFVAGFILSGVGKLFAITLSLNDGIRLSAYSLAPFFAGGILGIVPPLAIAGLLAGIFSFYVYYQGVITVLDARAATLKYFTLVSACAVAALVFILTAAVVISR
jgi:hypothetical protein